MSADELLFIKFLVGLEIEDIDKRKEFLKNNNFNINDYKVRDCKDCNSPYVYLCATNKRDLKRCKSCNTKYFDRYRKNKNTNDAIFNI
jgi:hypothetical protein